MKKRHFLKQVSMGATYSALTLLNNICSAQTNTTFSDYKTLVCVFLYGGSDSLSMTVPIGRNRDTYVNYRGGATSPLVMGVPATPLSIAPTANYLKLRKGAEVSHTTGTPATKRALYESGWNLGQEAFQRLYRQGYLAAVGGVGPLVEKVYNEVSKSGNTVTSDFRNASNANGTLPSYIGSHSDQQNAWQSFIPLVKSDNPQTGWGARLADYLDNMMSNESNKHWRVASMASWNLFESGLGISPTEIGLGGPLGSPWQSRDINPTHMTKLAQEILRPRHYENLLEREYAIRSKRALISSSNIKDGYDAVVNNTIVESIINNRFPFEPNVGRTGLDLQFINALRMIVAARNKEVKRQVLFVSQDGYDTHGSHNNLLLEDLSKSLEKFYLALSDLSPETSNGNNGHDYVNQVTSFTMSDFGRQLLTTGGGTDHGWGGNHLVVGGSVKGGFYGKMPDRMLINYSNSSSITDLVNMGLISQTEVNAAAVNGTYYKVAERYGAFYNYANGQLVGAHIPEISCEEYIMPLAKWFGLDGPGAQFVFPNAYSAGAIKAGWNDAYSAVASDSFNYI
jgi:uncharacterized protein (DUF1501 family)